MSSYSTARVLQPRKGPTYSILGELYTIKMSGADTGGAYALFEFMIPPDHGPPPHVHTREDECFYILEGELTFYVADERLVLGAGGFLSAVRNVPHRFRNEGSRVARALCMVTPAGLDQYFMEVGELVKDPANPPPFNPAQAQVLVEHSHRYGLRILTHG
ncbi:MAG: cupin domain-containing protein [Planctomycetota bacterium]|nr:MAG: cupin domain-containing protein [Planctomycetota bacterium]